MSPDRPSKESPEAGVALMGSVLLVRTFDPALFDLLEALEVRFGAMLLFWGSHDLPYDFAY